MCLCWFWWRRWEYLWSASGKTGMPTSVVLGLFLLVRISEQYLQFYANSWGLAKKHGPDCLSCLNWFPKKTELTTRLTGGGRGRRRHWVLRLEILQEEEDHQGTGAVGKTWNHERIRMMRMLMIRWRRPRTSRAWWRPRRSPTSWRRNRSRWDWSLIPLDKDKTDSFQMSITTIESRNAKRYNHVICWAPHHLARGPLSLKCGDGLEEDLKVASATSRSPLTQDLKWDQGIGLWDFSNDYGLFKMPWTRILLLSLEIANNWVRITWVSTYSDQIRLICTN